MRETESLCAENIGLKDIARSRRGELISRGELIMYYRTSKKTKRKQIGTRAHAMDSEQDKTDFLNLIESSFRLLEKAREAALSATNSIEGSVKSNSSSGSAPKSESVSGTGNGRTKPLRGIG